MVGSRYCKEWKTRRPEGALGLSRVETTFTKGGRMRVAYHAGDGYGFGKQPKVTLPESMGRGQNLGQQQSLGPEGFDEGVVPIQGMDIEQQRSRGVGVIGAVGFAPGQFVEDPGVHRAEMRLA